MGGGGVGGGLGGGGDGGGGEGGGGLGGGGLGAVMHAHWNPLLHWTLDVYGLKPTPPPIDEALMHAGPGSCAPEMALKTRNASLVPSLACAIRH